jgi:hypothetical protein
MSKQRQKGTSAESAVVNYLNDGTFPKVERRSLNGAKDRGDIAGLPGVVIEVKNCATMKLAEWVDEALVEALNDDAEVGVVWHKRKGRGNPGDWYVSMNGHTFAWLLGYYLEAKA